MKSFEVQVRRGANWKVDSTYDDRDLAEQRARQYEATRKGDGVRVIEEAFVESTQKYKRRTVYRDSKFQEDVQTKIDSSRAGNAKPKTSRQPPARKGSGAPGRPRKPPAKSTYNVVWILAILALIVGLGIGAIMALEHFRNLS